MVAPGLLFNLPEIFDVATLDITPPVSLLKMPLQFCVALFVKFPVLVIVPLLIKVPPF